MFPQTFSDVVLLDVAVGVAVCCCSVRSPGQ